MKVSRILVRPLLLCTLCLLLALAWGGRSRLAAQQEDPKADGAATTIAYMQRFLDDQQPPHRLEAMSATPCTGGFAGPYPCHNVDLLAFLPLADIGGGSGNDIWGWTDPLDDKEYALMGRSSGTAFVDITDPENPIYLGNLPTHTSNSSWRDIKVYANHAFVVSEASGHGMQVFDLTELRDVVTPPVTFAETAHYPGFGNAHNLAINEETGFAYAIGSGTCSGGLHMVNIQDPDNPTNAGCFSSDGYTHDTQCVIYTGPDVTHQGKEICFSSNEDTLTIVDVTNKATPIQLSRTGYSGSGYTHQGWLTEDQVHFLMDDELDESTFGHNTRTRIWDVSNLDAPVLIDFYDAPVESIDHNLYTLGDNVYEANYRSGLRILDASDLLNMTEAGFFDIYPSDDNPEFNGSWSVFPYYESGVVVVSGIEQGLFVLQPILAPDFQMDAETNNLTVCAPDSAATTLDITDRNGYTGSVTLSTAGLPAGSTAAFTTNPVVVPGSTDLTVTVNSTPAGLYPFDVIGSDGTITHTEPINLSVFDSAPGVSTLLDPPNGANNVSPVPTFEWTAATQGYNYELQVATDAGFTDIVYSAIVNGLSHTMTESLQPETLYYWRVRSTNECGIGSYSAAFSFTVRAIPPILLVDDDDNGPDVQATYSTALGNLSTGYDLWDTANSDDEPTLAELLPYEVVIWFTGDEFGGSAGPGSAAEAALGDWLDGGNCLFISSQDYHYDRGMTPFMEDYLGAASITDDDGEYASVTGVGSVFGGLGPYSLTYPFNDYSDPITPDGTAELAFDGNNGNGAAINKDNGTYRTTFWVYPWEAINDSGDREEAMQAVLDWCSAGGGGGGPSMSVAPESIETALEADEQITETLSISNNGDATLTWDVYEDGGPAGNPAGGWSDNFDTYATGSQIHGQGGWKGWFNDPNAGAFLTDTPALSAPNSVDIVGASDLVHEYSGYTSGQWVYTAWQYIPSDFTGVSYFILLNAYDDTGATNNWSTQVNFDAGSGLVVNDGASGGTLPLVTGEWVEIRVEIDLDNDTQEFYYDGQLLYSGTWTDEVSGAGSLSIGAVDLYANGATSVYYDDLSLTGPPPSVCEDGNDIPWLSLSPPAGSTSPGGVSHVTLTFDSTGLAQDVYTGTLCVTGNDLANPLVTVPVTLTVTPDYEVDAMTADADLTGEPGTIVTYTVEIHNTGDVTDTYDLSVSGNTWMTELDPTSVTVAPGGSETVWVTVHIPGDAGNGDTDIVTVTATSQSNNTVTDSVDLTTTATAGASEAIIYLPVVVNQ